MKQLIEPGKLANMILVGGNPVEHIFDIRKVEMTIKNGNVYRVDNLCDAVGVKYFR